MVGDDPRAIMVHLEYIKARVDSINANLAALNGRTRVLEERSAAHTWAISATGIAAGAIFAWVLSKL